MDKNVSLPLHDTTRLVEADSVLHYATLDTHTPFTLVNSLLHTALDHVDDSPRPFFMCDIRMMWRLQELWNDIFSSDVKCVRQTVPGYTVHFFALDTTHENRSSLERGLERVREARALAESLTIVDRGDKTVVRGDIHDVLDGILRLLCHTQVIHGHVVRFERRHREKTVTYVLWKRENVPIETEELRARLLGAPTKSGILYMLYQRVLGAIGLADDMGGA